MIHYCLRETVRIYVCVECNHVQQSVAQLLLVDEHRNTVSRTQSVIPLTLVSFYSLFVVKFLVFSKKFRLSIFVVQWSLLFCVCLIKCGDGHKTTSLSLLLFYLKDLLKLYLPTDNNNNNYINCENLHDLGMFVISLSNQKIAEWRATKPRVNRRHTDLKKKRKWPIDFSI